VVKLPEGKNGIATELFAMHLERKHIPVAYAKDMGAVHKPFLAIASVDADFEILNRKPRADGSREKMFLTVNSDGQAAPIGDDGNVGPSFALKPLFPGICARIWARIIQPFKRAPADGGP
jgi:hypothetical protein